MSDEEYEGEKEIQELLDKIHRGELTDEDWQRFVELTHWDEANKNWEEDD